MCVATETWIKDTDSISVAALSPVEYIHLRTLRGRLTGQVAVQELCSGTQLKLVWWMITENFPPLNTQNRKLRSTTKISEL